MGKAPNNPSLDPGPDAPTAALPGGPAHLTPEQVARLLGGEIIGSYVSTIPARPVAYGLRDAITVLMGHGHRVSVRDGASFVDGERVEPEVLARLADELEPGADRAPDVPEAGN